MNLRKHKGDAIGAGIGLLIVAAHAVLGAAAVLTASQWVSGVVIGVLVLAAVGVHLLVHHLSRRETQAGTSST